MHIKTADDRAPDIEALRALLERPGIDERTRRKIETEIWAIRLGVKAESDAAYQIDFDLKDSRHWAVIHDLRIDVEGKIAQIDHLVISRMLEVFVCESKSFTGGVKVNEYGEWITFRDGRPVGIPSPVEQNRRHIAVLERVIQLGYVELPHRLVAIRPSFHNRVLVSSSGSIGRPRTKLAELDSVVKVDQFRTHLLSRKFSDLQLLKLVSSDTLQGFGLQLVALHTPHRVDWAARFGLGPIAPVAPVEATPDRKPWLVKYDGPCANCGTMLAKGNPAVWRPTERRMLCLECASA